MKERRYLHESELRSLAQSFCWFNAYKGSKFFPDEVMQMFGRDEYVVYLPTKKLVRLAESILQHTDFSRSSSVSCKDMPRESHFKNALNILAKHCEYEFLED